MHFAVSVRCWDEGRDDKIGVDFAYVGSNQYHCNGTDLFLIPSIAKQFLFAASLRANNKGDAVLSGVRSGEEEVSEAVVVEIADKEEWSLDEDMTSAEAEGSVPWGKFGEMLTDCWPVHTGVSADLVDIVQKTKQSITLVEQQKQSSPEWKMTQHEWQMPSSVILKAQHHALSNWKEAFLCRQ